MRTTAILAGALWGMSVQADPHPWIAELYADLRAVETDAGRGALEAAGQRALLLRDRVADALPAWREDLENVRERALLSDFAVFVRDVPAAVARREPRRIADALGRCRAILDHLRLVHDSR